MKSKLIAAFTLALSAVLLMTAIVAAEQGGGTGTLTAEGDGLAAMKGNGSITISGSGVLSVRDIGGDANINVSGKGIKREPNDRTVIYIGFDGQAQISGSNIVVSLKGKNIQLEAVGSGKFVLRGQGKYHTDKEDGVWTEMGKVITLP